MVREEKKKEVGCLHTSYLFICRGETGTKLQDRHKGKNACGMFTSPLCLAGGNLK